MYGGNWLLRDTGRGREYRAGGGGLVEWIDLCHHSILKYACDWKSKSEHRKANVPVESVSGLT